MEGHDPSRDSRCTSRVIIHLDLDAFYCQVERKRKDLCASSPLAVQQWEGLIAVNYPARAQGVKRFMRAKEAKAVCPDLILVHVDVVDGKAVLEPYRRAGKAVLEVITRAIEEEDQKGPKPENSVLEKASIDECYLDITNSARRMAERLGGGQQLSAHPAVLASHVIGTPREEGDVEEEGGDEEMLETLTSSYGKPSSPLLLAGAVLASAARKAVFGEMGYTLSAGIGPNKLLAKLASSRFKPNKQTIVMPSIDADRWLAQVELKKLRGMGGKMGAEVEAWVLENGRRPEAEVEKVVTAGCLQQFTLEELRMNFSPETSLWLWQICRGIDMQPVKSNLMAKSFASMKTFSSAPLRRGEEVKRWLGVLAKEICARLLEDREENNRQAKTLVLHYTGQGCSHTRSFPTPKKLAADVLSDLAYGQWIKMFSSLLPCSRIGLAATELSVQTKASQGIARFLTDAPVEEAVIGDDADQPQQEDELDKTSADDGGRWCRECERMIPAREFQSHMDYHYAMRLQQIENGPAAGHSQAVPRPKKRKKPLYNSSQRSMKEFFN